MEGDFFDPERWPRIDDTHPPPDAVARRIAEAFGFPAKGGARTEARGDSA